MDWLCKYCNCNFGSKRKLRKHYSDCKEKQKLPKDKLGRVIVPGQQDGIINITRYKAKNGLIKGHKHSDATKKKMSIARKRALSEGRGSPWICPYIKRSYAEQYFYDVFSNANLKFDNNVWICKRYCVDFLFGNYYFEVDGEQHYTENGIIHDQLRDEFLKEHGFILIDRCRWKCFCKLSNDMKKEYIDGIIKKISWRATS